MSNNFERLRARFRYRVIADSAVLRDEIGKRLKHGQSETRTINYEVMNECYTISPLPVIF